MPNTEVRAMQLSNLYYNQGLEQAGVRDLTGAVTKLRQSLLLNKRNTQARNLLGLICWEMGEAGEAIREWMISRAYQPKNNIAADYIRRVQADKNGFQNMKDAAGDYNKALANCREGHDDMAAVQLRRVMSRNPRMVRAGQLLALIEIRQGREGQARKVLRRIEKIDRTNPVTLRYLKAIEEITAAKTKGRRAKESEEEEREQENAAAAVFRKLQDLPSFSGMVNILIGLALGILAAAFLVVPAVRRSMNQETNSRVVNYTTTLAEQKDRIDSLEAQIRESDAIVEKAKLQVEDSQSEVTSYDSLVKAYNFYMAQQYMMAVEELDKIDPNKLTTGSAAIYAGIHDDAVQNAYSDYVYSGNVAYAEGNWDEAIRYLEKALSIRMEDSDPLQLLALAYDNKGDTQKAIEYYQKIIDNFPNTWAADNAAYAIIMLGGETDYYDTGYDDGYSEETYKEPNYDNMTLDGQTYTVQGYDGGEYMDQGYTEEEYTEPVYSEETYDQVFDQAYDQAYDQTYDQAYDQAYDQDQNQTDTNRPDIFR